MSSNTLSLTLAEHMHTIEATEILNQARDMKLGYDQAWLEPFTHEEVQEMTEAGHFYVAISEGLVSGCVLLLPSDERIWGKAGLDEDALYIHKLATGDDVRGQNFGTAILHKIGELATSMDKRYLRLDCPGKNLKLVDYYLSRGFSHEGYVNVQGNRNPNTVFYAAKMQKKLSS